jgi:hypothetical protein
MKLTSIPAVVLLVLALGSSASAAGLISQIPKDGEWVRYQWSHSTGAGETSGTLTMSSVGSSTVDGQLCRWLELKLTYDEGTVKHAFVTKVLAPEKDIKAEASFMPAQVWFKVDDAPPVPRLNPKDAPEWLNRIQLVLKHVLLPLRDAGKLNDKTIEYQHGKLTCSGLKQTAIGDATKVTINGTPAEWKTASARSLWMHKDVPFGIARCESQHTFLQNGEATKVESVNFFLSDFGSDAKTELPSQN